MPSIFSSKFFLFKLLRKNFPTTSDKNEEAHFGKILTSPNQLRDLIWHARACMVVRKVLLLPYDVSKLAQGPIFGWHVWR